MMKPESERGGSSSTHEPKYRGVRLRKWGKWVSEIRMPNSRERIWLGSYDSPEQAARAFDAAAFCLRGHAAKFNFPDQPPNIPGATTLSSSEIQAAAARHAYSVPDAACHAYSVPDAVVPMEMHSESSSSSVVLQYNNINNVMDYGIFPGFDDYFMQPPPVVPQFPDYNEDNSSDNGDISQGPSFLWNY
ncbi:putative transcription factor AP2-EREBP family [Helianthus debilis subsp. tardiflorus]